jgi:hypothetical protein
MLKYGQKADLLSHEPVSKPNPVCVGLINAFYRKKTHICSGTELHGAQTFLGN